MARPTKICALIVAAGSSRRIGFDKLLTPLQGKPVLAHTLTSFVACPEIWKIFVVVRKDRMKVYSPLMESTCKEKWGGVFEGGKERCDSVWNGLQELPKDTTHVAIHDAARPLIRPHMITTCIRMAEEYGASACAEPLAETLQRADDHFMIRESIPRENLWRMQTPQVFEATLLKDCYAKIRSENRSFTDETSALLYCGKEVRIVPNPEENLKITFAKDIRLAECLLQQIEHP